MNYEEKNVKCVAGSGSYLRNGRVFDGWKLIRIREQTALIFLWDLRITVIPTVIVRSSESI